ncbi:N-6 DNA methylase [Vibrio breoganii]|uniref:N-6 DNA methylase n=1 Tax=Vibrio breoganii TaxID=553239 RepID=UPI000C83AEC7|nr:N-6 DNA methylase [Vibrio breoganii]PMK62551.1 hypothetical protein BCT98_04630 [Vibrio breoganii]
MDYKKVIWKLTDICRGQLESKDAIDIISTVIACASLDKERFRSIANMGSSSITLALENMMTDLQGEQPKAFEGAFPIAKLEERTLATIVYEITDISDLRPFSEAIHEVLMNATGKRAGEYSTSDYMLKLLPALVGDASGLKLLDATSGLARTASKIASSSTTLQEINLSTVSLSQRLFIIQGKEQVIFQGDSLLHPQWREDKFDLVVMQPPLSMRLQNETCEQIKEMPYVFIKDKDVPRTGGDVVWIQFVLHQLNNTGKGYLILPQGSLFRGGYDGLVRDYLLDNELVDSVVALPAGSLSHTGIAPVLLVLSKGKQKGSPIRFVDLTDIGSKERNGVKLSDKDLEYAVGLVNGDIDEADKTLDISVREIRQTTGNLLNVARYIQVEEQIELPSVEEKMKELEQATTEFQKYQSELLSLLSK